MKRIRKRVERILYDDKNHGICEAVGFALPDTAKNARLVGFAIGNDTTELGTEIFTIPKRRIITRRKLT